MDVQDLIDPVYLPPRGVYGRRWRVHARYYKKLSVDLGRAPAERDFTDRREARWVRNQRARWERLSPFQKAVIGGEFGFDIEPRNTRWHAWKQQYETWVQQHGTTPRYRSTDAGERRLADWWSRQEQARRNGTESAARRHALAELRGEKDARPTPHIRWHHTLAIAELRPDYYEVFHSPTNASSLESPSAIIETIRPGDIHRAAAFRLTFPQAVEPEAADSELFTNFDIAVERAALVLAHREPEVLVSPRRAARLFLNLAPLRAADWDLTRIPFPDASTLTEQTMFEFLESWRPPALRARIDTLRAAAEALRKGLPVPNAVNASSTPESHTAFRLTVNPIRFDRPPPNPV